MYRKILSFVLCTHLLVFSSVSQEYSILSSTISPALEQSIVQDICSCTTFPSLSTQEKQLFLQALLLRFTDATLELMETITKAQLIPYLQEKPLHHDCALKVINIAEQLKKISLSRNNMHSAKKNCFAYLKQHHESVMVALEHVKSSGRALTIELTNGIEHNLDACSKTLSTTITSTIKHLVSLHNKLELPLDKSLNDFPSSIIKLNNIVGFSQTLEYCCQNLQSAAVLHLPLLTSIIEPGLCLVNIYYKAVYKQLRNECSNNECFMFSFNSSEMPIPMQHLPEDLTSFFHTLINQSILTKK